MNKSDIGRLAEDHGKYIYGFCLRLTNDTYNAEELYQDTFLKALEKASSIDENNNPRAYLAAIALSLWKNSKRKFARRAGIAPTDNIDNHYDIASDVSADGDLLKKELCAYVSRAVSELDEKLRLPVLLFYTAEMSVADIAAAIKCPEGTVKSRLHSARTEIKKKMEVYENGRQNA